MKIAQIGLLLTLAVSALGPSGARADAVQMDGAVSVLIADDTVNHVSRRLFSLETAARVRYQLDFGAAQPVLRSGQQVHVEGERQGDVIHVALIKTLD